MMLLFPLNSLLKIVCVCVFCVCAHVWVGACVGQISMSGTFFNSSFFRQCLWLNPELPGLAGVASQQVPGILLPLPP